MMTMEGFLQKLRAGILRHRSMLLVLTCSLVVGASSSWHWSQTFDESNHLEMGRRILSEGNWERFDNSKMPVSALNAAPWLLAESASAELRLWLARLPQWLWLLGSVLVIRAWALRLGSPSAALGVAALVAWDPSLLSHAFLVTTDAPCVFFTLLCPWLMLAHLEEPSPRRAALAGCALGGAQLVKFTSSFLVPILVLFSLLWCLSTRRWQAWRQLPVLVLTAWLTLTLGYGGQGLFLSASEFSWRSEFMAFLSDWELPLLLPQPWLEGLDWVRSDDEQGHGNIYLEGTLSPMGRGDYFWRALLWKAPLPLLLLGSWGLLRGLRSGAEGASRWAWLLPPTFLMLWFSLAFNFQLGLRYILPVLPFIALQAARLSPRWIWAGAGWTLLSSLSWWPWGLSYFNERLTQRHEAWRHLADSNLDWGQTQRLQARWLEEHPDGLVDPQVPGLGPMLISANVLTGVLGDPSRMACLREHFPPKEELGYALYPLHPELEDLAPCFPQVELKGHPQGRLPAGEHLVVLWFRGRGELSLGGQRWSAEGGGEQVLGVLVRAEAPFDLEMQHEGPEAQLFLDGRAIETGPGGRKPDPSGTQPPGE